METAGPDPTTLASPPSPTAGTYGERRAREAWRVFLITFIANIIVAAAKLIYGFLSGSLAIIADGFHSLIDSSNNVLAFIAIWISRRPPDPNHPYGHGKFEPLAAMAITFLLFLTVWELAKEAVARFQTGEMFHRPAYAAFIVIVATIVVNLGVWAYESAAARRLSHHLLAADAGHTFSDILVSASVLVSLVLSRFGVPHVDTVVGLGIAVAVAWVAYTIVRRSLDVLSDASAIDAATIREIVRDVDHVRGCHKIRSRGFPSAIFLDLHVRVDSDLTIAQAHTIGHQVRDRLHEELPQLLDITVHVEPNGPPLGNGG